MARMRTCNTFILGRQKVRAELIHGFSASPAVRTGSVLLSGVVVRAGKQSVDVCWYVGLSVCVSVCMSVCLSVCLVCCMYACMYVWIGWTDGWMDGWVRGWM